MAVDNNNTVYRLRKGVGSWSSGTKITVVGANLVRHAYPPYEEFITPASNLVPVRNRPLPVAVSEEEAAEDGG